jgi:phosphate/sulfate permease
MPSFLSLIMLPEIYFPIIGFLIIVVLSFFLKKFLNKNQN